ncbi:hypothetical protein V5O48_014054 [Marasmius crinis-equi]|uniref:Uncharacterized protein n=1 Tax=Marasmius crinis-equi TaxID=585013 RepID=A0ABR3EYD7_9AGAR
MSGYSSFQGADRTRIGDFAQFNQAGNVINVENLSGALTISGFPRESQVKQKQVPRELDEGDVILREEVSSEILEIKVDQSRKWGTNNPFRDRVESTRTKVKVQRRVYTAEIVECGDRLFTVYQFKPEDEEDKQALDTASILNLTHLMTLIVSADMGESN